MESGLGLGEGKQGSSGAPHVGARFGPKLSINMWVHTFGEGSALHLHFKLPTKPLEFFFGFGATPGGARGILPVLFLCASFISTMSAFFLP